MRVFLVGLDGVVDLEADDSAAGMSAIGKPTHSNSSPTFRGGGDKIQSLRVWEPPSFCMAFFWYVSSPPLTSLSPECLGRPGLISHYQILVPALVSLRSPRLTNSALPPTAPLLTYILTPLHPLLTPLIHLSTTFLLSHLSTSYAQLVKDRQFLSAEVMREYDQRFVYRKVFASRVDRGTQTNQGE